jgi:polysaccharide deacetylase family protein (PEP-CTERM system associated)
MPPRHASHNVFTVDLEDWFHVCGIGGPLRQENWHRLPSRIEPTTLSLLDLLDRTGVKAMFFAVGWIAERHPRLIEQVREAGHDIGSHGYSHQRAYDLGPEAFRSDLRASMAALAAAGVPQVTTFRAPEWSVNNRSLWALRVLAEEGFTIDASMAPLKMVGDTSFPRTPHMRHTAAGSLLEVPPLVGDRLGQVMPLGWGWGLRMSSPRRVLRALDAANRDGASAVLTVHPWELDPDPPRVKLPLGLHFAHYFRLSGFRDRLREVLQGSAFGSIGDVRAGADT